MDGAECKTRKREKKMIDFTIIFLFLQDMKQHQNHFDVIIVDASDPVGPADVLFEKPFYMAMKNALRAGGIVATQGENMWLHLRFICIAFLLIGSLIIEFKLV